MIHIGTVAGVCLCLAVAGRTADAQSFGRNKVNYDRLDFRVLQTEHFDIHYYEDEEAATLQAARMAERWYARYSRLLGHTFTRRQPLVLYASHAHFSQTNLTPGSPGEGTGGFTEARRSRIAMPFAAGLGETDHVLGHEIAHAFQIDIAKQAKQNAFALPLWFIEGMAEYLSLGEASAHTTMWVRDASRHGRLPALDQLDEPRFFPYRFGHALWSYVAARYGDGILSQVLRSTARGGALRRLEQATGLDAAELTADWHASIGMPLTQGPVDTASALKDDDRGRNHVAPALSPDGRHLMFLSERDRMSMDLYLSDTDSGLVLRRIVSTAADPHFDSLQYIHSSGSWDPSGRRFAMTALRRGDPVLVLFDVARRIERIEVPLTGVHEVHGGSWSPDGTRLVVSALKGGLSDLFVFTVATRTLAPLTADAFADLHPAWSADGRTIAFATDRFTSSLDDMRFGTMQIGLIDLETGLMRPLLADRGKQISPQWSPDGDSVFFVSDRDGTSNIYRATLAETPRAASGRLDAPPPSVADGYGGRELADAPRLQRVTHVAGGVSGITATSPALSVASRTGGLAFSVFENGRHQLRTLSASQAAVGVWVEPAPAPTVAPALLPDAPTVAQLLAAPAEGLPTTSGFETRQYDDRLQLESLAQPFIGATTGNAFGGVIRASLGATFGDLLRDRQLHTIVRGGTDLDDFAAQFAYVNRRGQWHWGVVAGFAPARFYGARRSLTRDDEVVTREMTHLRYVHQWGGLAARYNLDAARRIEIGAGVRRTGFEWQTVTRVSGGADGGTTRVLTDAPAGRPASLSEAQIAYVHDTAVVGPASPVLGQRLRVEVAPVFGGLRYADVRVDLRRYLMPIRPVTIAARVEHVGRYGPGALDPRVTPLIAGLQSLVRGYDLRTFAADECGRTATSCSLLDELTGSRMALVNLEVRVPLRGLLTGDLDYGRLPIEAIAFADAGFLWTRHAAGPLERDRFRSVGAGARANIGGFVVEATAARPFDRAGSGWTLSVLLRPGW